MGARRAWLLASFVAAACTRPASAPSAASPPTTIIVATAAAPVRDRAATGRGLGSKQDAQWFAVAKGLRAEVLVERMLYEKPGSTHFFVRVRVLNLSTSPLGVDLRSYFDVFYPNQWGASQTRWRETVNEGRLMPQPLDAASRSKLLADFRAGLLTQAPAHGSLDYFRDFNASARADVEAQARGYPFVIIAMDGRLDVSDGIDVDRVLPGEDPAREVLLEVPVRWGLVPAGAIVLGER